MSDIIAPTLPAAGSVPLQNLRHETFCMQYAGPCWGKIADAYAAAGYDNASPATSGWTLMQRPEVRTRVAYLREQALSELGIDAAWIARERLAIAANPGTGAADRRAVLRDLEQGLGLAKGGGKELISQVNVQVNVQGSAAPLGPEFAARLQRLEQRQGQVIEAEVLPDEEWLR